MMELDDRCNLKVLFQTFLNFAEIHVVGFIKYITLEKKLKLQENI